MRRYFLPFRLGLLVLFLSPGLLALENTAVSSSPSESEFAISSISVQDTNLICHAIIPSDITQVMLQIRLTPDAPWLDAGTFDIPPGQGEAVLTFPKPTNDVCFFRLEAADSIPGKDNGVTNIQVSSELRYATIPSLATKLASNGDAIFHFKGFVDGSDKILITHEGAFWTHLNWSWPPAPVTINGTHWNPEAKNYLTSIGDNAFLPAAFSLDTATLEVAEGRDVVALERATNGLVVYLDDTPVGAGEYEFTIHFHSVTMQPVETGHGATAQLKIAVTIDGSDCLKITPTEATWEHKYWSCPAEATLNDVHWYPRQTNILVNAGTNLFLPSGVDLSSARIVRRAGRDLATMWAERDVLWVWFADNPDGSDYYQLELSFGQ